MAMFKDCEIWFAKVDPAKPNGKFNKENPTWEVQLRTSSKDQKKEWIAGGLSVKDVIPEEGPAYFRANLRKKSIKTDGTPASFVDIIDGKMKPIDPKSIGNGSIGNVRVFQYEYDKKGSKEKGIATVLMGIQLTKHVVYVPKVREDDFGETDTETVEPDDQDQQEEGPDSPATGSSPTPSSPSPTVAKVADDKPASAY